MAYIAGVAKRFRILYYKGDEMNKRQQGFTLVELAIVLVIIGLILGMAFKGRELIDGARVRSMQAAQNKIQAAINTYFERYGELPGDGCIVHAARTVAGAVGLSRCPVGAANPRSGSLTTVFEARSAINILLNTNLLSGNDIKNPFGGEWALQYGAANFPGGLGAATTVWMVPAALPVAPNAAEDVVPAVIDSRYVCRADQIMDDSAPRAGVIRTNLAIAGYTAATDCWTTLAGTASFGMRVLP